MTHVFSQLRERFEAAWGRPWPVSDNKLLAELWEDSCGGHDPSGFPPKALRAAYDRTLCLMWEQSPTEMMRLEELHGVCGELWRKRQ